MLILGLCILPAPVRFNCLLANITVVFLLGFRNHSKYSSQWWCIFFLSWQSAGEAPASGYLAAIVMRGHKERRTEIGASLTEHSPHGIMKIDHLCSPERTAWISSRNLFLDREFFNLTWGNPESFFNRPWRPTTRNKGGISATGNSNCDWRQPLRVSPPGSEHKYGIKRSFLLHEALPTIWWSRIMPCVILIFALNLFPLNISVKRNAARHGDRPVQVANECSDKNGLCGKLQSFL